MKKLIAITSLCLMCTAFASCGAGDNYDRYDEDTYYTNENGRRTDYDTDRRRVTDSRNDNSAGDYVRDAVDGAENAGEDIINGVGDAADDIIDGLDGERETDILYDDDNHDVRTTVTTRSNR